MIQTCTYLYSSTVCIFHDECKQGIDQQIFNRKSISRKITHPQSLFKYQLRKLTIRHFAT